MCRSFSLNLSENCFSHVFYLDGEAFDVLNEFFGNNSSVLRSCIIAFKFLSSLAD